MDHVLVTYILSSDYFSAQQGQRKKKSIKKPIWQHLSADRPAPFHFLRPGPLSLLAATGLCETKP